MMNEQEVLNTVYRHLIAQRERSVDGDGGYCLYRGPKGLKCAAGVLIKDEFYDPSIEGTSAFSPRTKQALLSSGVSEEALPLVAHLQVVHDQRDPEAWPMALGKCASFHGLETPWEILLEKPK